MMLAESSKLSGSWIRGRPGTVRGLDPTHQPYVGLGRQFGGMHGGGAPVAMADAPVRWVSDSISPAVFEALATMAGGETVPGKW
jgi:Protein of unknown function (DUF1559)